MTLLDDRFQFARERFDEYEPMAVKKVQPGEYKAEKRRGLNESECLIKKLQTKKISPKGKRLKLMYIWS